MIDRRPRHYPADPTELAEATWYKSSRSSATQGCVEVAHPRRRSAVRDSKNPDLGHLDFADHEWSVFVRMVRTVEADL